MKLPVYIVNAFSSEPFRGNPAAVCPLPEWLDESTMQSIASQHNLSETAFIVADGKDYQIRWFTPAEEVPLCGHATLAAAEVIRRFLEPDCQGVGFLSMSGRLDVHFEQDRVCLNFPAMPAEVAISPGNLGKGLGLEPREVLVAEYYLAVLDSEAQVRALRPDMALLASLDRKAVIVTAPGDEVDFVSRFFAPRLAVDEDPVTGSAHCTLVPYWASRLGKTSLRARQLSHRGGELFCQQIGDRVQIGGYARLYLQGEIII
ncbi:MAG: PhzF family phenazine biosynthesis protein [Gammaproteobacteria bacterium]|nr:PhzF family phenazine biosynthesis protein [Gammaproteobacteria bacterium]